MLLWRVKKLIRLSVQITVIKKDFNKNFNTFYEGRQKEVFNKATMGLNPTTRGSQASVLLVSVSNPDKWVASGRAFNVKSMPNQVNNDAGAVDQQGAGGNWSTVRPHLDFCSEPL